MRDEAYTLPWVKQFRADVYNRMVGLALSVKASPSTKAKRTRLAKLRAESEKLARELRVNCTHPLEEQKYDEVADYDTLGNMSGGIHTITCTGCRTTLWTEES